LKRIMFIGAVIAVMLLALVACNQNESVTETGCPAPGEGASLYTYEPQGYCLLYPDGHNPVELSEAETVFVVGDVMNHVDPRFSVNVTDAAGEGAVAAADRIETDFGIPGMATRETVTLGGVEAIVLDNMPGQDLNRRVIAVHNGRLYDLTFVPVGADYGEIGERTEEIYQLVLDSFRFTE
jgi:hypothetical protein